MVFLGFAVFIAHLELLYILRYNQAICLFTQTLRAAGGQILSMFMLGGVVFLAFASLMNLSFGSHLQDYAWLTNTLVTLAQASIGKFDFHAVKAAFGTSGAFLLLLYLLFITLVGMNFFITLLCIHLEETSSDEEAGQEPSEVIQHLESIVKSFISSDSDEKTKQERQTPAKEVSHLETHPIDKQLKNVMFSTKAPMIYSTDD